MNKAKCFCPSFFLPFSLLTKYRKKVKQIIALLFEADFSLMKGKTIRNRCNAVVPTAVLSASRAQGGRRERVRKGGERDAHRDSQRDAGVTRAPQ